MEIGRAPAGSTFGVTVCLNSGQDQPLFYRAQGIALGILRQAGIDLKWRKGPENCSGGGIVVELSPVTAADVHPGALAYAMPYETRRIVLLLDRVRGAVPKESAAQLLGHVLAHEIVHVLQRADWHSGEGLMKARWAADDYAQMKRGGLKLAENDRNLIRRGLGSR
jgi:hypothetical protein